MALCWESERVPMSLSVDRHYTRLYGGSLSLAWYTFAFIMSTEDVGGLPDAVLELLECTSCALLLW